MYNDEKNRDSKRLLMVLPFLFAIYIMTNLKWVQKLQKGHEHIFETLVNIIVTTKFQDVD